MPGQTFSAADPQRPAASQRPVGLRWMYALAALYRLVAALCTIGP